jgi:DNA-binding LacI/PurR family transcriptional regulator
MIAPTPFHADSAPTGNSVTANADETTIAVRQWEIAARLGVSHSTVSMALRDHPRVSADTKLRVKRLAEEMGYRPDPALRRLNHYGRAKRKSSAATCLGWINAWPEPDKLKRHPEYGAYWEGASKAAARAGYRLEEFRPGDFATAKALSRRLREQGARGLLLPPEGSTALLNHLPWEKYHVVSLSHRTESPVTHLVAPDRVDNSAIAFRAMRSRGYHRIGFLTGELPATINGKLSAIGFLSAQLELPESERLPIFSTLERPFPHAFAAWVARHRPDAILSDLPDAADFLEQATFGIPHDLGLALCAVQPGTALAGTDPNGEEIGRAGVELLKNLIDGYAQPDLKLRISIRGSWRDGDTLPARN